MSRQSEADLVAMDETQPIDPHSKGGLVCQPSIAEPVFVAADAITRLKAYDPVYGGDDPYLRFLVPATASVTTAEECGRIQSALANTYRNALSRLAWM